MAGKKVEAEKPIVRVKLTKNLPSLDSLVVVTATGAQSISPAKLLHSKEGQEAFTSIVRARPELQRISVTSIPSENQQADEQNGSGL